MDSIVKVVELGVPFVALAGILVWLWSEPTNRNHFGAHKRKSR